MSRIVLRHSHFVVCMYVKTLLQLTRGFKTLPILVRLQSSGSCEWRLPAVTFCNRWFSPNWSLSSSASILLASLYTYHTTLYKMTEPPLKLPLDSPGLDPPPAISAIDLYCNSDTLSKYTTHITTQVLPATKTCSLGLLLHALIL